MENISLLDSFSEFKDEKTIDRVTLMVILEEVFRNTLTRKFGSDENFDIIINPDKGDLEIWRNRIVVKDGEVEDPNAEIEFTEAVKIEPDFEVGEEVSEEFKLIDLGRRSIQSLRQNLVAKVFEHDSNNIFNQFKDRVGEIFTAEVLILLGSRGTYYDNFVNIIQSKVYHVKPQRIQLVDLLILVQVDSRGTHISEQPRHLLK